jgi:DNA primase
MFYQLPKAETAISTAPSVIAVEGFYDWIMMALHGVFVEQ